MPTSRPFAYNPGATVSGTEQVGNLAIGWPTNGFSSTGLTWWNGPDEDSGYVIAKRNQANNQPTPVGVTASVGFSRSLAKTDSSFLALANSIGSTSFASASAAKTWLNANGYWTSWGNIVTTNLTLKLDAADSASYPGSGTTWTDLVDPQQNITLVNTPTYTASAPSYFSFNGSNQYGTGSGAVLSSTSYTKSVWFYLNGYADNNLVSSASGGHFIFMSGTGSPTTRLYCGHANWSNYGVFPSTATFNLSTWYNATLTFNTTDGMKLYVNGSLDSTYTANKSAHGGNSSTNIATYGGGNLLNGRIAKVYCYDRSLTASEVTQNWEADKSKFGY